MPINMDRMHLTDTAGDNSSSDEDLFDFVGQFQKLKKEKKNPKIKNPHLAYDQPPVVNNSHVDLGTISETEIATTPETTMNIRLKKSQIPNSGTNTTISKTQEKSKKQGRRQSKNRRRIGESSVVVEPVICIGDFDDGYDIPPPRCPTVRRKSIKNDEEENNYSYELLNREINVGVFWRKVRVHRFSIRMFQPIDSIYEHFAKLENINTSQVSLKLKNKILSPTDSPHSINYKIVDFIEGDIEFYKNPFDSITTKKAVKEQGEVTFRIKQKDVKHPVSISMEKTDRMCILYIKVAEKLGLDVESFTLEFDGEVIKKSDTIESLDLDGDESFDLFKKNIITS